jgi:hypothetical protein
VKAIGLALVLVCGIVYGPAAPAHAESCEGHLVEHGATKSADIAGHASGKYRGESPCGYENDRRVDNSRNSDYNDKGKDRKSRYCRKTWWC